MSTATVLEQLEAELAQAREVHERLADFAGPGDTTVQPWVIALAAQRVMDLELRMEHARNPQDHQDPAPAPRPRRDPEVAARVREWNRRRRLERARATATRLAPEFETPEPPLDHGELSIPGRAGATLTDAALDRWRTYRRAQATIRCLAGPHEETP
ncbi:hypothetical protein [uncultured Kocuria sp.]|uniref:hypothetical protein n=1 Tax=uncultured Kocuria sp. TaxID=259305 RepID=UPI0025DA40A4|nr:hypothetical protein [uncultured Kocuria sp.]